MISDLIHILVLAGIVVSAVIVIWQRDLISAAIALGACSLLLSLEFFILGAPDVAIAEAGVGAALTTAIFIMAIKETIGRGGDGE
ncbi:MAG: hydrogenase subunit MbhD domain-containing protein [Thermoplasmata archaeon]